MVNEFLRTPEAVELVRRLYWMREMPPNVARAMEGRNLDDAELTDLLETIRQAGICAREVDQDAWLASLDILSRAQS